MDHDHVIGLYRQMLLIRRFEEKAREAFSEGKIGGFLHLYIGEEAVAVGALNALRPGDDIITHYRDHGYALALGCDPGRVMAELYGRATGLCKGKGGSMHLACGRDGNGPIHFWGGYAIVGGHLPLAAGLALASKQLRQEQVVLAIFGEGATNIGEFHEALNLASLWKLPVVFLCENNRYAMGTAVERASAVSEIHRKTGAYGIPSRRIDGGDVLRVREATAEALDHARSGRGPYFLEVMTYRFQGHSMLDPHYYRTKAEVEEAKQHDPIVSFQRQLESQGALSSEDAARLAEEVGREVEAAVRFAEESPEPPLTEVSRDVYAEWLPPVLGGEQHA